MTRLRFLLLVAILMILSAGSARAADPFWEISVVSSDEATLLVDLRLKSADTSVCWPYACQSQIVYYRVTPCPLAGPACLGAMTDYGHMATTGAARIALQPGQSYTFSGRFEALGLSLAPNLSCTVVQCTSIQTPLDLVYGAPLPVDATTWGKVKALYRMP